MVSAPARRRQVEFARKRGLSYRRACLLLCVARSSLGYESRKATADAPVLERMRQLASMDPATATAASGSSWPGRGTG